MVMFLPIFYYIQNMIILININVIRYTIKIKLYFTHKYIEYNWYYYNIYLVLHAKNYLKNFLLIRVMLSKMSVKSVGNC